MDPTDPGRVRQLGQGVLQRDGFALAGVPKPRVRDDWL